MSSIAAGGFRPRHRQRPRWMGRIRRQQAIYLSLYRQRGRERLWLKQGDAHP